MLTFYARCVNNVKQMCDLLYPSLLIDYLFYCRSLVNKSWMCWVVIVYLLIKLLTYLLTQNSSLNAIYGTVQHVQYARCRDKGKEKA